MFIVLICFWIPGLCACVCVCVCVERARRCVCVCVCVCVRVREGGREGVGDAYQRPRRVGGTYIQATAANTQTRNSINTGNNVQTYKSGSFCCVIVFVYVCVCVCVRVRVCVCMCMTF